MTVDESIPTLLINSDYRQESFKAVKHEEKAAPELKLHKNACVSKSKWKTCKKRKYLINSFWLLAFSLKLFRFSCPFLSKTESVDRSLRAKKA